MPSLCIKLIVAALIVSAVLGSLYAYGERKYDQGQADLKAEYDAELVKAEAKAKQQRADDQAKNEVLASDLESIRSAFADLKANPPKPETLIKYREVKVSEQVSCPVASLDDKFRLYYNAAASL